MLEQRERSPAITTVLRSRRPFLRRMDASDAAAHPFDEATDLRTDFRRSENDCNQSEVAQEGASRVLTADFGRSGEAGARFAAELRFGWG